MRHVRTKFFTICYSCNISWSKTANGKHACVPSSRCFVKRKSFVSIKKQAYRSSQHTEQNIGFKTEHILWCNKSECLALQYNLLKHSRIQIYTRSFLSIVVEPFMFLFFWHCYVCMCASLMLLLRSYDDYIFPSLNIL